MADDIVIRLVLNADAIQWEQPISAERHREAAEEIKRLRAAGDALVAAIRDHDLTEGHIKTWEEARRG